MGYQSKLTFRRFCQVTRVVLCLCVLTVLKADATINIAFVGASFTAGAGNALTPHKTTSQFMEHLRHDDSVEIRNFSPILGSLFDGLRLLSIMTSPIKSLNQQIQSAVLSDPDMIIMIDALFWVVYSSKYGVMERLEQALDIMSKYQQNYAVSLLPFTAITLGHIQFEASAETIKQVNKRLEEWSLAQNKSNPGKGKVLLLDLGLKDYFGQSSHFNCGKNLGVRPITEIRSEDRLHPTEFGYLCLTEKLMSALINSPLAQFNFISSYFDMDKIRSLSEEYTKRPLPDEL